MGWLASSAAGGVAAWVSAPFSSWHSPWWLPPSRSKSLQIYVDGRASSLRDLSAAIGGGPGGHSRLRRVARGQKTQLRTATQGAEGGLQVATVDTI